MRSLSEVTQAGGVMIPYSFLIENESVKPGNCDIVMCKELSYVLALTKTSTLQTAVVCFQGWCVSKHKALSALLTACRR